MYSYIRCEVFILACSWNENSKLTKTNRRDDTIIIWRVAGLIRHVEDVHCAVRL